MAEYIEREKDKYIKLSQALEVLDSCACWWAHERMERITADDVALVRHGRWYRFQKVYIDPQTGIGFARDMYKCDACNVGEEETRKPYCPICGAKMDKEDANGKTTD